MRRILNTIYSLSLIVCMLFVSTSGFAQVDETDPDQIDMTSVGQQQESVVKEKTEEPKKFDTRVELGSSFSFSPNNYYGNSYYIAPQLSYMATPRLRLSVGVAMEYTQLYPTYSGVEEGTMLPMTRAFMYARGSYLVSQKVTVYGTAFKTINDVPRLTNSYYPNNYDYSGFDVGVNYKVSESFSIGVQLRMDNGPGYQPYNNGLFPSHNSPFMYGY